tara:strand:- start:120 stop:578 length:459 start_codon:yes stop_codon:yes gene_type:complete
MPEHKNHNMTTSTFGAIETNGLNGADNFEERGPQPGFPPLPELTDEERERPIWARSTFSKFLRVRLISDVGFPFWDLSYCFVELVDGSRIRLGSYQVPGANGFGQFVKSRPACKKTRRSKRTGWAEHAVNQANEHGVNLRSLGFWSAISTLQ